MGLTRATSLVFSLLALMTAHSAVAGKLGPLSCMAERLQSGLYRLKEVNTLPIEIPAEFHASDQELANAFSGNSEYHFLSQLFSEKRLSKFRHSSEAIAIRNAILKGGAFHRPTARFTISGSTVRTQDSLKIVIDNLKFHAMNGDYHGLGTETDGLKTNLAKALTGVYEAAYAIAAHYPSLSHVEVVADEILNLKLSQALTHVGFYSKKAERRLTDDEIKAISFDLWLTRQKTPPGKKIRPQELMNYVTLQTNATITHVGEHDGSVHFQFPELLPVGDPSQEKTRAALIAAGYTKKDVKRILGILSRRLTQDEELGFQRYLRSRKR